MTPSNSGSLSATVVFDRNNCPTIESVKAAHRTDVPFARERLAGSGFDGRRARCFSVEPRSARRFDTSLIHRDFRMVSHVYHTW